LSTGTKLLSGTAAALHKRAPHLKLQGKNSVSGAWANSTKGNSFPGRIPERKGLLPELLNLEPLQDTLLAGNRKFHGIAANLTVLHIGLGGDGSIYKYGYGFPAIRALEKVFDHLP
jgi:hypothetical protein